MRPLIVGTILGVCFYGISLLFPRGGNVPPQDQTGDEIEHNAGQHAHFDLLVLFDGKIPHKGQVVIQLFDNEESFSSGSNPRDECFLKLEVSDEVLWQFRDLPKGKYAIKAFHDANENWKLDTPSQNDPGETFSYSFEKESSGSDPTFENCNFNVDRHRVIRMKWSNGSIERAK